MAHQETSAAVGGAPKPKFGALFVAGLVLLPWLFCWFLLRQGYSTTERVLGFSWAAAVLAIVVLQPKPLAPPPSDPAQEAKSTAAAEAQLIVQEAMRDPSSAQFGQIWGIAPHIACGTVNGKNAFGAMAEEQEFIYALGSVEFDDRSRKFARHWNSVCLDKLLTAAPDGVMGLRWGSRPTAALTPYAPPTNGLALYLAKAGAPPLEGVPVKEADFRFDHGRLYAGDIFIDGQDNRDAVKVALTKKYGTPLQADDQAHRYQWGWPDRHVTIEMSFQEKPGRTQVTFARGAH